MESLLEIRNLGITFEFNGQTVQAVRDSSFKINKGECLAIVGESGSGKSVTALAIMRLIRSNSQLRITGSATYEKKNLLNSDESSLQNIRGKKINFQSNNAGGILGGISTGQEIIISFIELLHEFRSKRNESFP